jgi:hypothetical protein
MAMTESEPPPRGTPDDPFDRPRLDGDGEPVTDDPLDRPGAGPDDEHAPGRPPADAGGDREPEG